MSSKSMLKELLLLFIVGAFLLVLYGPLKVFDILGKAADKINKLH
jgi:hypothetical protein